MQQQIWICENNSVLGAMITGEWRVKMLIKLTHLKKDLYQVNNLKSVRRIVLPKQMCLKNFYSNRLDVTRSEWGNDIYDSMCARGSKTVRWMLVNHSDTIFSYNWILCRFELNSCSAAIQCNVDHYIASPRCAMIQLTKEHWFLTNREA